MIRSHSSLYFFDIFHNIYYIKYLCIFDIIFPFASILPSQPPPLRGHFPGTSCTPIESSGKIDGTNILRFTKLELVSRVPSHERGRYRIKSHVTLQAARARNFDEL